YPEALVRADAVLVPGGFGRRGVEGMMRAIQYAREKRVPFFGICLGLQTAVIEYARHVAGLEGANSTEFEEEPKYKGIFKLRDLISKPFACHPLLRDFVRAAKAHRAARQEEGAREAIPVAIRREMA